jgi:hypothetical protein
MNCFGSWGAMSPVLRETAQSQKVRYRDGVRQMAGVAKMFHVEHFSMFTGFWGKVVVQNVVSGWFGDGEFVVFLHRGWNRFPDNLSSCLK